MEGTPGSTSIGRRRVIGVDVDDERGRPAPCVQVHVRRLVVERGDHRAEPLDARGRDLLPRVVAERRIVVHEEVDGVAVRQREALAVENVQGAVAHARRSAGDVGDPRAGSGNRAHECGGARDRRVEAAVGAREGLRPEPPRRRGVRGDLRRRNPAFRSATANPTPAGVPAAPQSAGTRTRPCPGGSAPGVGGCRAASGGGRARRRPRAAAA